VFNTGLAYPTGMVTGVCWVQVRVASSGPTHTPYLYPQNLYLYGWVCCNWEWAAAITRDQQGYGKPWGFSKGFVEGRGRG